VSNLLYNLSRLDFSSVIDILLVALVFYWILTLIQGTQAEQLLRGVLILSVLAILAASAFNSLTAFSWLLDKALPAILIAIPVIFQPELRRALERVGRTSKFLTPSTAQPTQIEQSIEAVIRAVLPMSRLKHGALIVFERSARLTDHIETGIQLDALISSDLLRTIFVPGNTLHDGAVIIRDNRIIAASVILPLGHPTSATKQLLGTRHLAAVGITEITDAVVVVVSEETGVISIAYNGQLIRGLDQQELEQMLKAFYSSQDNLSRWRRFLQRLGWGGSAGRRKGRSQWVDSAEQLDQVEK
jgi:diadenylate cyclase